MLEVMGRREVLGWGIWGGPYNVWIIGWCSMSDIKVFCDFFEEFVERNNVFVDCK